jgi:hypothetical protein
MTRKLFVLTVLTFVISVSTTLAGPGKRADKGASNNGVGLSFAACDTPGLENCGQYASTPFETVDGASVFKFVTNDGSNTAAGVQLFDVFQLPGTIAPGSELVLNLNNINNGFGDFACANSTDPTGGAIDSLGNPLTGPCTVGQISALANLFSESDLGNTATFTFLSGTGFPASWTFYAADGNLASFKVTSGGTTPTPEPGSASLLLAGALAVGLLAVKARR